jgi:HEXXH motif-containing protein
MSQADGRHRLSRSDLSVLVSEGLTAEKVGWLRSTILSKHKILLEGVRRAASRRLPSGHATPLESAIEFLAHIQSQAPEVVSGIMLLPHLGAWATDCLRSVGGGGDEARPSAPGSPSYLSVLAAVAGLRSGRPFSMTLPVNDGEIVLPDTGVLHVPPGRREMRIHFDGRRMMDDSGMLSIAVSQGLTRAAGNWSPIPRIRAVSDGVVLDVAVESRDIFLARYGQATEFLDTSGQHRWQYRFQEAWRILVRHHRPVADALAAVITTIVPLSPRSRRPASATSGSAFGAIALSLPPDSVSLAETLIHEFQHLVLGVVEDVVDLVRPNGGERWYAPWREDPRPAIGLLQGCYAYLAVTEFWRNQRGAGTPAERLRADVEFARWREATLAPARTLISSGTLTEAGRVLTSGLLNRLAAWRDEAVSGHAADIAAEVRADHRLRWRVTRLRPDADAVGDLARAWSANSCRPDLRTIPVVLMPAAPAAGTPVSTTRVELLEMRYRDSMACRRLLRRTTSSPQEQAAMALLRGAVTLAARRYTDLILATDEPDAWVGFALTERRRGAASWPVLSEHIEVVVALHRHLREAGESPTPHGLANWLATGRTDRPS